MNGDMEDLETCAYVLDPSPDVLVRVVPSFSRGQQHQLANFPHISNDSTTKNYFYLPRKLFLGYVLPGAGKRFVAACPLCRGHVGHDLYWTETGSLNNAGALLDYIECATCHIRLYPAGGSFAIPDIVPMEADLERAKRQARLASWGRWTDNRTAKERRRIDTAIKQKMSEPSHTIVPASIVKSMRAPHITSKGRFHRPEIYTLRDVAKLDELPNKILDLVNSDPHHTTLEAWERSCSQPPQVRDSIRYNK